MIDDSLGAGATMIRLTLADNRLIGADNGSGMTCSKLREAHVLNNRSAASATKHGRFGIGRKHALVGLTQILAPVRTLTATIEGGKMVHSELLVDYPRVLRTDTMELTAHEITKSGDAEWQTHAITPSGTGTITIIPLPPTKYAELKGLFTNKDVRHSLMYTLGLTYHQFLEHVTIEVVVEGVTQTVRAINPLAGAATANTAMEILKIYRSPETGEIQTYYETNGQTCRYLIHDNRHRNDVPVVLPGKDYEHLGDVTLLSAYMDDWLSAQNPTFELMGLQAWNDKDTGVQDVRPFLGGIYIRRNGKIIHRTPAEKPKSNDKNPYTIASFKNARLIIEFRPVITDAKDDDLFTLDDVFNVQINKSKVDVAEIDKDVAFTYKKRFNEFRSSIFKKLEASELASATATAKLIAPTITSPVASTASSSTTVKLPAPSVTTAEVPVATTTAAGKQAVTASQPISSNSSVSPPPAIVTVQPVAKVQRAATTANVPVSDRRVIEDLEGLAAYLYCSNFEELKSAAGSQPKAGNAALCSSIAELIELIEIINDQVE